MLDAFHKLMAFFAHEKVFSFGKFMLDLARNGMASAMSRMKRARNFCSVGSAQADNHHQGRKIGLMDNHMTAHHDQVAFPLRQESSIPLVLVVDDDLTLGNLLASFIHDQGYEVSVQSNGADAYHWLRDHHPMIILTDLEMPFMDGWELCEHIQQDAADQGTCPPPIIVMTAQLRVSHLPPAIVTVLNKPFDASSLEDLLNRYLPPVVVSRHPRTRARKFRERAG